MKSFHGDKREAHLERSRLMEKRGIAKTEHWWWKQYWNPRERAVERQRERSGEHQDALKRLAAPLEGKES